MAPVTYTEDTSADQREQFFEASILHRIPTELLIQSSSSTQYFQSFPNGRVYRSWLSRRRKNGKEERLRKLAKFHAELLGRAIENDKTSGGEKQRSASGEDSCSGRKIEVNVTKNSSVDRNELLLDITLRTMVLLHHNQQLQNKLTALQMETRNFVRSSSKKPVAKTDCATLQKCNE